LSIQHIVPFTLDGQRYALLLSALERVIHTTESTPLPKAPPIITGIINFHGEIIPVVDIRARFGLPSKTPGIWDHMIIAKTSRRKVALPVDTTTDVIEFPEESIVRDTEIAPRIEYVRGVAKINGDLVLIHDLETFLSLDEHIAMDAALKKHQQENPS
jgi:purine-binding chemotaxis protein CheW